MKREKQAFWMGAFVLTAFVLLILAGILFGGGRWFQDKLYFETYFDASVQGLTKGSAVQFRGVHIGEVESISFAFKTYGKDLEDASEEARHALRYIRVLCSIDTNKHPHFTETYLQNLRDNSGLVTRLSMQGITGTMMVNLDFVDVPPPVLTFTWEPKETYIPSYPTTLESMISVAEKIATNLEKIDFSETVGAITNLTTKLTQAVEEANVQGLSSSIESCVVQVGQLVTTLNDVLATTDPSLLGQDLKTVASSLSSLSTSLSEEVPALTAQARETLEIAKGSLSSIASATTSLMPLLEQWGADEALAILPKETANSMEQLSQTLRVFESLLQSLRERPSRLLFDDEP